MKKALWASIDTTSSTSLDEAINPHDCEKLAASELLRKAGYEVWLLEPYILKRRHSSYPWKVTFEEAKEESWDLIVCNAPGPAASQVLNGPWSRQAIEDKCDFLLENRSKVVLFLADPRKGFTGVVNGAWKHKPHRFYELLENAPVLVPDSSLLLDESRAILIEYWKLLDYKVEPYSPDATYGSIYVGVKNQTPHRKKVLKKWFEDSERSFTGGPLDLKGVPSLTNYKSISKAETMSLTGMCSTVLVTGEPTHTWLTPRAIQALCCGTIASIESTFAARHHIPDSILSEQTCDRIVDFDNSLRNEEVYARQLSFMKSLKNSAKIPEI